MREEEKGTHHEGQSGYGSKQHPTGEPLPAWAQSLSGTLGLSQVRSPLLQASQEMLGHLQEKGGIWLLFAASQCYC